MSDQLTTYGTAAAVTRPQAETHMASVESQRAIAEVQASLAIAKRFPRDPVAAVDRILVECQRRSLAEVAVYQYARGGSDISGPSIRLAETIARQWGNLQYGIRELEQKSGESTMQAYCWDTETNVRRETTWTVPHVRDTKKGRVKLEDSRDIYEAVANQGARRMRACILGVVPGDIVEEAVRQCEETLRSKADTSQEGVKRLLLAFEEYGVTREQIETRIQRRIDSIQPAQIVALRRIYNSLRDNMSQPGDWFETRAAAATPEAAAPTDQPAEPQGATSRLKSKIKKEEPKAAPPQQPQPKAPAKGEVPRTATTGEGGTLEVPCPDRDGAPADVLFCQGECGHRGGCPTWEEVDR